jgi:pimeloyl-ACP methyl ester carboxylesterase
LTLHVEAHGEGDPLVLLHGGLSAGETWAPIIPDLGRRRVLTVDLPGHGRSPDNGRPLRAETLADEVATLIEEPVDLLGYSLGGMTALRLALQHPEAVKRLVLVSVAFRRSGSHPDAIAAMDAMAPEAAGPMKQSPVYELYARLAPNPEDWELLVARTAEALKVDYDWTAEAAALKPRTLLVYADADSVTPAHIVECWAALGGGLRDARWDGSQRPANQLAILPGTTHYDIALSPALAPTVARFLDAG